MPSLLRDAWLEYVDSSEARGQRDRAALQAGLRAAGRGRATPAPAGPVFTLTRDMTDDWFRTDEARRIADNVFSFSHEPVRLFARIASPFTDSPRIVVRG